MRTDINGLDIVSCLIHKNYFGCSGCFFTHHIFYIGIVYILLHIHYRLGNLRCRRGTCLYRLSFCVLFFAASCHCYCQCQNSCKDQITFFHNIFPPIFIRNICFFHLIFSISYYYRVSETCQPDTIRFHTIFRLLVIFR